MQLIEEKKVGETDPSRPEMNRSDIRLEQRSPAGVAALTPEQRALLILRLRRKTASRPAAQGQELPLRRAPRDGDLPLSFAQQRLWFLHQLDPESPAYNQLAAVRLVGRLDKAVLERALGEIIRRHEILRTNFQSVAGKPDQVIRPAGEFILPVIDLTGLAE